MNNFEDLKSKIVEELNKRIPNLHCPICDSKEMILTDGFFNHLLNKEISGNLIIGGPSIPTVTIICKKCGHIMEFAVGVLGLLPKKEDQDNQSKIKT